MTAPGSATTTSRVTTKRRAGWWSDTLAKRLFLLMCVALVGSHLAAFIVVGATVLRPAAAGGSLWRDLPTLPSLPPTPGVPELRSAPRAPRRGPDAPSPPPDDAGPGPRGGPDDRAGGAGGHSGPGGADGRSAPSGTGGQGPGSARPPPDRSAAEAAAPDDPASDERFASEHPTRPALPWNALLLDYGVRFAVIALAAWYGSRWLAAPMQRLAEGSRSLAESVSGAGPPPVLDDRHGTREVREAARVFNEMASELRQQFRSRGLMVAAISHDLRTPLTRLRMRLQSEERGAPELKQRSIDDIHEMSALIDNALELFRIDGAAASDPPCSVDVDSLLQSMVDDRAEQGQPVSYRGCPAVTLARPAALRRVVDNLIGNALRYGERADLTLEALAGELCLSVDDTGPGIAPAELEAVFEPFYRVETSRNRHTGGTGLGLYIARELMRRDGGALRLSNRPEGGLRAELVWPFR